MAIVKGLTEQWLSIADAMVALADQTRAVEPHYFYLELVRRKDRCSVYLRWRTCGRRGSSLQFDDPRLQTVLNQLPMSLRRQYMRWQAQKDELNSQVRMVRLAFGDRLSNERLQQKLLEF